MRRFLRIAIGVLASAACAACGGDDDTTADPGGGGPEAVAVDYALIGDAGWVLTEAIQPLTKTGEWDRIEPSLDWWAEYERFEPVAGGVEGLDVRLSGHDVGLATQTAELAGFALQEATVGDRRAVLATGPDGKPAVVSIEVSADYTVMALSYALDTARLTAIAATLDVVTLDEWIAAGGIVMP